MGTRIEPIINGNDCLACWSPGETPKYMWILFEGILKGDPPAAIQPPNGRIFKLTQDPGNACNWIYNVAGPSWQVTYWRSGVTGRFHVTLTHPTGAYFDGWLAGCPTEGVIYSNLFWEWWLRKGYNGVATVVWMEDALALLTTLGLENTEDTFMELFIKDSSFLVYKICNTRFGVNQTIEMS